MNNKGFTLIEILAVIGILGILIIAVNTNFFNLIGSKDQFEDEELYKYLDSAAEIYNINNPSNTTIYVSDMFGEYVDSSYGIIKQNNLDTVCATKTACVIEVNEDDETGEKTFCVSKYAGNDVSNSGKEGAC